MSSSSRERAVRNYRQRLGERGIGRFEVMGRLEDRTFIRALARRLAEGDPEASRLRGTLMNEAPPTPSGKGGILAALRRSPLVGLDLDFDREVTEGREIDL